MSGSFRTYKFPGPEPRESYRLRLENEEENVVAHLSAMWCVHGGMDLYRNRLVELGPDPLQKTQTKKLPGIRCKKRRNLLALSSWIKILFVCGVHPNQRSSSISGPKFRTFGNIVSDYCRLESRQDQSSPSPRRTQVNLSRSKLEVLESGATGCLYNHKMCRKCGGPVINWVIATRKRKVLDGKIVDQALKDIPTGGLVDFPTNLDDLIWPSADPKTLKKENKTSDSVPSSLASLSAVMDLSIEQENPVTGRKGRTGRKQEGCTDDKIEAEKQKCQTSSKSGYQWS
ncbi:hypothetical protein R1flu_019628 [Riccia fluitans]|uniref:Uncharacterized protein n=1 Tax=Riccia fluitans TaxID=41844 RepID=A0ABD1ZKM3_9MARC